MLSTLDNFLNLYWIRPEVAVWRTLDVTLLRTLHFRQPIIDLGCGDGTFAFTLFNGKTNSLFDVYKTISDTSGFYRGDDIHTKHQIIKPKIIKKPNKKIQVGLDWKKSLLEKASTLKIYQKILQHDLCTPLPLKNNVFDTVFSNVFYWVDDIDTLLMEASRITKNQGKIILILPDSEFKKNLIYNLYKKKGHEWANFLDRGIYQNISKNCFTSQKWEKIFSNCGLAIDTHYNYLSPNLVKLWNLVSRPLSPYFIELANQVGPNKRKQIKSRVIKEMKPLLISILKEEIQLINEKNCFHLFVLNKK